MDEFSIRHQYLFHNLIFHKNTETLLAFERNIYVVYVYGKNTNLSYCKSNQRQRVIENRNKGTNVYEVYNYQN